MRSTINLILFAFLLLSCELTVYGAKCPPTNDEGEALGEMVMECYDSNTHLTTCPACAWPIMMLQVSPIGISVEAGK